MGIAGHHPDDRVPDFSTAGYGPLPDWRPATQVLVSTGDERDRTDELQHALDRGGIIELSGAFTLRGSLRIERSDTIVRGSPDAILTAVGGARTFVTVGSEAADKPKMYGRTSIVDDYVPVGATRVRVADPERVSVGSRVFVERKVTSEWLREMDMAHLVRNGASQTWLRPGVPVRQPRTVAAIEGDTVVLDIPLTDSLRQSWAPELVTFSRPPQTNHVGLANLTLRANPSHSGDSLSVQPSSTGIVLHSFVHSVWLRGLVVEGFLTGISVEGYTASVTVQDSTFVRNRATDKSRGWPTDISLKGTGALLLRCRSEGTVADAQGFAVATQTLTPGPNAVVDYTAPISWLAPHQRYGFGCLFDNCDVDKVELANRGVAGSGHGWSVANAMVWNCRAKTRLNVEKPPTAQNWAVGCIGKAVGDGSFIAHGHFVRPLSLFSAQLERRAGSDYARRILGPSFRPSDEHQGVRTDKHRARAPDEL